MALSVFQFICTCLTIRKSGNPWWSAFIPYYSKYIMFKMAKKRNLFWPYLGFNIAWSFVDFVFYAAYFVLVISILGAPYYGTGAVLVTLEQMLADNVGLAVVLLLALAIIAIGLCILNLICCIGIARAFGRSTAFGVGLFFIPAIFYAILAFDNATEYIFDADDVDAAAAAAETTTYYV